MKQTPENNNNKLTKYFTGLSKYAALSKIGVDFRKNLCRYVTFSEFIILSSETTWKVKYPI